MTPGVRIHVVMPPGLIERIDSARGEGQSRGDWVRRAVERQLDGYPITGGPTQETFDAVVADRDRMEDELLALRAVERALEESGAPGGAIVSTSSPAPAEQPDTRAMDLLREDDPDPDFIARGRKPEIPRSRVPFRRDVKPFQRGES